MINLNPRREGISPSRLGSAEDCEVNELASMFLPSKLPSIISRELQKGTKITEEMIDIDYISVSISPAQLLSVAPRFFLCSHVQERYIIDELFQQWEYPVVISTTPWTLAFADESLERPIRKALIDYLDETISCCPVDSGVGFVLSQRHVHTELLIRAIESVSPRLTLLRLIGYGMKLPCEDLFLSDLWKVVSRADNSSVFDFGRSVRCEEIILFREPVPGNVSNVQHYPMLYKMGLGAGGTIFSPNDFEEIQSVKVYSEFAHRVKSHSNIQFNFPKRVRSLRGKQVGLLNLLRHLKSSEMIGGYRIRV